MCSKHRIAVKFLSHHQEARGNPCVERGVFEIINPYLEMGDCIFKTQGEFFLFKWVLIIVTAKEELTSFLL